MLQLEQSMSFLFLVVHREEFHEVASLQWLGTAEGDTAVALPSVAGEENRRRKRRKKASKECK